MKAELPACAGRTERAADGGCVNWHATRATAAAPGGRPDGGTGAGLRARGARRHPERQRADQADRASGRGETAR